MPVAVDTSGVLAGKTIIAIAAGGYHSAVVDATAPQPPTGTSGVVGDATVTLSWFAPGDDGGSPVLEYVPTGFPGRSTCTVTNGAADPGIDPRA